MNRFDYHVPASLDETFGLLDKLGEDARLVAGGTALIILMKQNLVRPAALVSLARVPGLSGVATENGGVRIGATTTHRAVETSEPVRSRLPVLAETMRRVATMRIRNVGTLGGNLAHADPNQDPPVTLIALGASVELAAAGGERTVPVEEFFSDYYETVLRPGELVKAIHVPGLPARAGAVYQKFLPRTADDYATVAVAAVVSLDESGERCQDLRLALGSVGPTPVRARAAEAVLRGQVPTPEAIREAAAAVAAEVDPITDIRGSADYKRDMAVVWARRTLEQAFAQAKGAPTPQAKG
jgi:aerobic carbon-monoxide dehydrogenase medium subunit